MHLLRRIVTVSFHTLKVCGEADNPKEQSSFMKIVTIKKIVLVDGDSVGLADGSKLSCCRADARRCLRASFFEVTSVELIKKGDLCLSVESVVSHS